MAVDFRLQGHRTLENVQQDVRKVDNVNQCNNKLYNQPSNQTSRTRLQPGRGNLHDSDKNNISVGAKPETPERHRIDSDNNNLSVGTQPTQATICETPGLRHPGIKPATSRRHRVDSERSGDSGYCSQRTISESSSENRTRDNKGIQNDRNGNDVGLSPVNSLCVHKEKDEGNFSGSDSSLTTVHNSAVDADNKEGAKTDSSDLIGEGVNEHGPFIFSSSPGNAGCTPDTTRNEHSVDISRTLKQRKCKSGGELSDCYDLAEKGVPRSRDTRQVTCLEEMANCKHKNKYFDSHCSILSGPGCSLHRKCSSFSKVDTNEIEHEKHRAQTRKRYKSEGNGESVRLLLTVDQTRDLAESPFNDKPDSDEARVLIEDSEEGLNGVHEVFDHQSVDPCRKQPSDTDHLIDSSKTHSSSDKGDLLDGVWGSSGNVGTFGSQLECDENDNVTDHSSVPAVTLRDKVKKDFTALPELFSDPDEAQRDSLTVNFNKDDVGQISEKSKASSSAAHPGVGKVKPAQANKVFRDVCCDACTRAYAELVTRIDKLTTDYQWQDKRTSKAMESTRLLKVYLTRLVGLGVLIITIVITLGLAIVVLRGLLGCDWLHEVSAEMSRFTRKCVFGIFRSFEQSHRLTMVRSVSGPVAL